VTIGVTMRQMGRDPFAARIAVARQAIERGEWRRAIEAIGDDDALGSPECLELRAEAAYGAGDFERCVESWENLHTLHDKAGDAAGAARAAAMIAMYLMIDTGLMAPVRGWLRCAERHLSDVDDHPVRAVIAMVRAYERFMCGSMAEARTYAAMSIELGERFGVTPAVVIGRTCTARLTILDGDVDAGVRLLEEVGALLMSGAADPLTTGMMYCEIICAAQGLLMPDLASEWTDVMEHWRHGAAVGGIHGRCRVHRAELLRLSGTCELAETEALAACAELRPWMRREFGWPLVELGNIRLLAGDLDGAQDAYQEAMAHSWSPQPGLALVHLARHDHDLAATMIADAIEHPIDIPSKERPPFGPLRLAPLWHAQAQIAAVRGDHETLRRAADALRETSQQYASPMLRAFSLLADGRLSLLEGANQQALESSILAVAEFNRVGAPFESATARLVVAEAYDSSGRPEQAAFERRTARSTFSSFGAVLWAERVDELIEPVVATPVDAPLGSHAVFRRDGDTRTVEWGSSKTVVRDLKGLRYVERLLADPGREFHAVQLIRLEDGGPTSGGVDTGIPVLDDVAKRAYQRRLAEIEEDIDDAHADNDLIRAELAERDREYIVAELRRAAGLGGRGRTVLDDAERARVSVTRSIRYSLDRLAEQSPAVAAHLRQHVRTGTYCAYEPDPLHDVRWDV
jgi:tetratricopeptide (TPR) repeat protein